MKSKICLKCGERKAINNFTTNKTYKKGLNLYCKSCEKIRHSKFYRTHKNRILKVCKKYQGKNKERLKKWAKLNYLKIKNNCRWELHYKKAKERCNNPNHDSYNRYGERGIKVLMTKGDFKFLWFRDKAYLLKRPSIHRKNNDRNYTLGNCRFIEFNENLKIANKLKKKKVI